MASGLTSYVSSRLRRGNRLGRPPRIIARSKHATDTPSAAAPTTPPFRRKAVFEALEPRVLLSADPLSAAAQAVFLNGLDEFRDWADRLDDFDLLSQPLPVLNTAIGAALDLPDMLQDQLIDPISDFLSSFQSTDLPTGDDLAGFISGLPESVGDVTGDLIGDDFLFGFVFDASRNSTVAGVDLGELSAAGVEIDIMTFGADPAMRDPSTSNAVPPITPPAPEVERLTLAGAK